MKRNINYVAAATAVMIAVSMAATGCSGNKEDKATAKPTAIATSTVAPTEAVTPTEQAVEATEAPTTDPNKKTVPDPPPTVPPAPKQDPILSLPQTATVTEDFSGKLGDWKTFGGEWAVKDGTYTIVGDEGSKAVNMKTNFSDFTFEADITVGEGVNGGLLFRTSQPGIGADAYVGYYAGISPTGAVIGKANNNWTELKTAEVAVGVDTTAHVKVVAVGSHIEFFVNDMETPVIALDDEEFTTGAIGVRQYKTNTAYDNISVVSKVAEVVKVELPQTAKYTNDFESGDAGASDWTIFDGEWSFKDGTYSVLAAEGPKAMNMNTNFADFTYEADIAVAEGINGGLVFRVANPGNGADAYEGYYAGINPTGAVVGKANNNWTELGTAPVEIGINTTVHVKVVASGSHIEFFVIDMETPVIAVDDEEFTTGAIGLRQYKDDTTYDNISVTNNDPSLTPQTTAYTNDFSAGDGAPSGWTLYEGDWNVKDGVYTVTANPGPKAVADGTNFDNFTYEADVAVGEGVNAGFIFRSANFGNGADAYDGYYAGISTTGAILGKANNNWTEIATAPVEIGANTTVHMKVVANGSHIDFYVKDMETPVISADDDQFTMGAIGLRIYQADGFFDNIKVEPIK